MCPKSKKKKKKQNKNIKEIDISNYSYCRTIRNAIGTWPFIESIHLGIYRLSPSEVKNCCP